MHKFTEVFHNYIYINLVIIYKLKGTQLNMGGSFLHKGKRSHHLLYIIWFQQLLTKLHTHRNCKTLLLSAGFLPRKPGFDPTPGRLGPMVDTVAL
jgi:hypothetical protein